jgi:esterase/lipase
LLSQKKHAAQQSLKRYHQQVWNKILNIKPCIDQISNTFLSIQKRCMIMFENRSQIVLLLPSVVRTAFLNIILKEYFLYKMKKKEHRK